MPLKFARVLILLKPNLCIASMSSCTAAVMVGNENAPLDFVKTATRSNTGEVKSKTHEKVPVAEDDRDRIHMTLPRGMTFRLG